MPRLKAALAKVGSFVLAILGFVAFLMFVFFGQGTITTIPDYAAVYLDDGAKTYIALPCALGGSYQTLVSNPARLSTKKEARSLRYKPDDIFRNTGAFALEDRSLIGRLLVEWGILPPITHWWDRPYKTEDGQTVYPNREPG